jgi:hypothetical protein
MDEVRSGDWLDFVPPSTVGLGPDDSERLAGLARHTGSRSPSPGLSLPRKLAKASGNQVNGTP